jgi:hypothetical protein
MDEFSPSTNSLSLAVATGMGRQCDRNVFSYANHQFRRRKAVKRKLAVANAASQ